MAVILSALLIGSVYARGRVNVANGAYLCPNPNGIGAGWGIGFLEVPLSPENVTGPLTIKQITVTSPDRRIFYPAFSYIAPDPKTKEILTERPTLPPFVQGIVRNAMDSVRPRCRIFFLFKGSQPLRVNLGTNPPMSFQLVPYSDPQSYYELLNLWLANFIPEKSKQNNALSPPAPSMIKNYLRSMLVYRMGLDPSVIGEKKSPWDDVSPINFTAPTPTLRSKMPYVSFFEDTTLNEIPIEEMIQKSRSSKSILPKDLAGDDENENSSQDAQDDKSRFDGQKLMHLSPTASALCLPTPKMGNVVLGDDISIEPIAMRVPKDCVYIRFGSFKNFMWFQDLTQSIEGDAMNLLASQSVARNGTEKIQTLLASRMTEMSKLMGPTVIQDVAFIGSDLFFDDGPSFGLLFQAANNFLLSTGINGERSNYLKTNPDAKEKTVKIAGKKVKFLCTPDGRIQSYYVIDGSYHLITTSKKLVEDFLNTSDGQESLGAQRYFKYARSLMPLDNKYTVFVYASEDFLYRIVSPKYWTEISRRRRSAAEIEMTHLAYQAALNEGYHAESIEDLVLYGYLPKSVLIRPDGSRLMFDDKGDIYDTKRGYCGQFRPVADMKVEFMSDYEIGRFEAMRDSFQQKIVQLCPLMVGLKVNKIDDNHNTLSVDARVAPFARATFEKTKTYFGPLDNVRLAPIPGDCIQAQAILNNARLIMGVRNEIPYQGPTGRPVRDILTGIFGNDVGVYFGTSNELGFLGLLGTFGIAPIGPPAEYTIQSRPDIDMRYRDQHIRLFSFQPEIPPQVQPYLAYEIAPTPQHIWIKITDPMSVAVGYRINDMCYAVSARTSLANLVMLQTMVQQLGVNPANAMTFYEKLSSAKMVSPIGGEYVYELRNNTGYWTDSALGDANMRNLGWFSVHAPEGYLAQPWAWFLGGDFQFKIEPEAVQLNATIDMTELGQ